MRYFTLLILLLCASIISAQENPDASADLSAESSEKRKDIRRLLVLTGAGDLGKQVVDQMVTQMKQQNANIPDAFWKEFSDGVSADDLIDLTIPAYEKHLSHEDVKQLIEFYQSPIGKKLVKVQPLIVQDSMQIGAKWGRELARKAILKMRAKGLVPGVPPGERF